MDNYEKVSSHIVEGYERQLQKFQRQQKAWDKAQPILVAGLILTGVAAISSGWWLASTLWITWLPFIPVYIIVTLLGLAFMVTLIGYEISHWGD